MDLFCGKCGTPTDAATGLCPNCDRQKMATARLAPAEKALQNCPYITHLRYSQVTKNGL